jgi:GT2 family glycosyltransferase
MIDNDASPGPGLFQILDRASEHMDILVPMFHVTLNVMSRTAPVRLDVGVGWQPLHNDEQGEWRELSVASSHLMFVRRRAFERMAKPYFRFIYDEEGLVRECEDLFFCRKAREAGLSIWGNQNFYAEHWKTLPLSLPGRSSPQGLDLRGVSGRVPALHAKAAAT